MKLINRKFIAQIALFTPLAFYAALALNTASAEPNGDLQKYQAFFKQRFPELDLVALSNGMYNFSDDKRSQYNDIMEFPPYEVDIEEGKELFAKPFKNGKSYADCFPQGGVGIAHTYPKFDEKSGKVKTLEGAINECRQANGEAPLKYLKGNLVKITAYMADTSRGKPISIDVPNDTRAVAAYEEGKRIYFTRRGPREFACYHCHWKASGLRIRGNELSPAVGQAANFPVYRSKWGEIGSIQRRYIGCMRNIGAVPLKEQTEAMNNLEYFHTFLSNGVPMNAPNSRF
ncbi:MAG: sulfur oxidation c-type cytochrome SoxA [Gammaproteobacteria bacterium]|jgi:sulfur-oxidizing protein SoxA